MSNKIFIDKKTDFIRYYKNELFELEYGCWVLNKKVWLLGIIQHLN